MHCSTHLEFIPILPRGLAVLLILSLLLQTGGLVPTFSRPSLAPLPMTSERWHKLDRCPYNSRHPSRRFPTWRFIANSVPRLLARWTLLAVLLHTSGGLALSSWSWSVLLIPLTQALHALWALTTPSHAQVIQGRRGAVSLQRLYQLTLVLLLLSSLIQFLSRMHSAPAGLLFPLGLSTWVTRPDDETEIRMATTKENHYTVTLRGAFTFVWEPRDGFEKWMFMMARL